jgi:hypothetical protein
MKIIEAIINNILPDKAESATRTWKQSENHSRRMKRKSKPSYHNILPTIKAEIATRIRNNPEERLRATILGYVMTQSVG